MILAEPTTGKPLTTGEADTLEMLKRRVGLTGARSERLAFEQVAIKNIAYFSGKSAIYLQNGVLTTSVPEDIPEHKVFYKVNLCAAALYRAAAKVLGIEVNFRAIPQSDSIRHRNIAEASERQFTHIRDKNNWRDRTQLITTMYAGLCGSGFYKVNWDQRSGTPMRFYMASPGSREPVPTVMLSADERRKRDVAGLYEDLAEGDVRIAPVSPFGVIHDWSSRDMGVEGCQWMADVHYVDRECIADEFSIEVDELTSDESTSGLTRYEEAVAFMSSLDWASPVTWTDPQDKRGSRVRFIDYYQRPSRAHKKGRRVCYAGGKILLDGPNPYVGDLSGYSHLPFVKQDWAPHPGRFWGRSLVEDLTNPNHYINETRSALLELVRIFGRPRTYIYQGSGLNKDEMTRDPGGVFVITSLSGRKPEHDPPVTVSPEVANIGDTCQNDLNMLASQQTAEQGTVPAQLRSGAAVKTMIEDRDIALSIPGRQSVTATRDVGRAALGIAKLYYKGTRIQRYMGTSGDWEFKDFQGCDLSNDIIIVGEPSIVDTANARRNELFDEIEAGALNPAENPNDRKLVMKALHYESSDVAIKNALRSVSHQESEIRDMMADPRRYMQPDPTTGLSGYPISPWDDHASEMEVLVDFFHTAEFKNLPPETQSVLATHWQAHAQALQKQQMQQMQMMEASKGAPGQKGRPSAPK